MLTDKKNKFLKTFNKRKVLVTGSTGFKGSWLCFWLKELNANVVGVALKPEKNDIIFKALKIKNKIKQYYLDINNFNNLDKIIKKENPNIVFHLAAQSIVSQGYQYPLNTFQTNLLGGLNLMESCRINKIKNLVFITSDKCYSNEEKKLRYTEKDILGGDDPYSASKAGAEIIFHSYIKSFFINKKKIKFASGRAGNVIGGGDMKINGIIPDIFKSVKSKKKLIIRNPNFIRPWQHVLEALSGYLLLGHLLIKNKLPNSIYASWNFGPKNLKKINVKQLVNEFFFHWGIKKNFKYLKIGKFKEAKLLILNSNKANKELRWKSKLTFKETINLTVQWYKDYLKKKDLEKTTIAQIKYYLKK